MSDEGSKGVATLVMGPSLERWFRDRTGGMPDGGVVMVCRRVERVVETTGQIGVTLLCPGRGEAGCADKGGPGEGKPRASGRRFGSLLDRSRVGGLESVAVDGLVFEIGLPVREGSREVEPRNLGDVEIPNIGNDRFVEKRDDKERERVEKD